MGIKIDYQYKPKSSCTKHSNEEDAAMIPSSQVFPCPSEQAKKDDADKRMKLRRRKSSDLIGMIGRSFRLKSVEQGDLSDSISTPSTDADDQSSSVSTYQEVFQQMKQDDPTASLGALHLKAMAKLAELNNSSSSSAATTSSLSMMQRQNSLPAYSTSRSPPRERSNHSHSATSFQPFTAILGSSDLDTSPESLSCSMQSQNQVALSRRRSSLVSTESRRSLVSGSLRSSMISRFTEDQVAMEEDDHINGSERNIALRSSTTDHNMDDAVSIHSYLSYDDGCDKQFRESTNSESSGLSVLSGKKKDRDEEEESRRSSQKKRATIDQAVGKISSSCAAWTGESECTAFADSNMDGLIVGFADRTLGLGCNGYSFDDQEDDDDEDVVVDELIVGFVDRSLRSTSSTSECSEKKAPRRISEVEF